MKHCKHDKCDAAVAAAADDDDADDDTDGDRATCSGGAGGGAASGDATTPTSADAVVAIINSRRTSIYAPISRRETPELREKLSMPPAWPADAERTAGLLELALTRCTAKTEPPPPPPDTPTPATATTAARPDESSLKKLLNANRIDTGVNTIYSGRSTALAPRAETEARARRFASFRDSRVSRLTVFGSRLAQRTMRKFANRRVRENTGPGSRPGLRNFL